MTDRPRLSVALCTHQGARYLPQQLASITAQTRLPDEVVVRDDGSSDGTVDLLREFAAQAPFSVSIEAGRRLGVVANFERAIAACRGELIALADQDDVWAPPKLAALEAALAREPNSLLAFSDADLIDGAEVPQGRRLWSELGFDDRERSRLMADPMGTLLRHPVVTGCTTAFRSSLRDIALLFPPALVMVHDRWLSLCAAARGPLTVVPDALVQYRVHPGQQVGVVQPPSLGFGRDSMLAWRHVRTLPTRPVGRFVGHLAELELLRDRLASHVPDEVDLGATNALAACIAHLERRDHLPKSRMARVAPVVEELAAGRYRRFGAGWASAAADLARAAGTIEGRDPPPHELPG